MNELRDIDYNIKYLKRDGSYGAYNGSHYKSSVRVNNSNRKQSKATILALNTPSWPDKYDYQILSKYLEGNKSYGANKVPPLSSIKGDKSTRKQGRAIILALNTPSWPDILSKYLDGNKN